MTHQKMEEEIADEEMIAAIVVAGWLRGWGGGRTVSEAARQTSSVSEQERERAKSRGGGKTMHYCLSSSLNLAEAQHWQTTLCR